MIIFTQSDQALYNKLKSIFGSLIPTEAELEKFVTRTNLSWKDFCIDLSTFSFQSSTEIIFDKSISNSLPKISENAKHIFKELPFCCLGHVNSTNSLYFYNLMFLTCNNKDSNGIDSIKHIIKYYLDKKQNPAIMIGIVSQNNSLNEKITLKSLESIILLIETCHILSKSCTIIYVVINNRILYPLICDYT